MLSSIRSVRVRLLPASGFSRLSRSGEVLSFLMVGLSTLNALLWFLRPGERTFACTLGVKDTLGLDKPSEFIFRSRIFFFFESKKGYF
jgi:hypothetical protein